ncbi:glyoxylase-like metal-dependent hydrolase (beta-lactamase superfamily II) [Pedobacter cryoconitis]|uniref:MBL fold metallo-hydrolase n=1 Tax=Pedobacter cryoconitis TaxID=188932 RepID=UPI0016157A72|nr:MBL fold metallo-hydrolase [Pedobacter cryoconitis]MBB6272485.1 glyoxylase-like metal-dependent hydrolase (beta-lactamase superfamily II) [Pedobacter cryoconitis]
MNRRTLIKHSLLLGLSPLIPFRNILAANNRSMLKDNGSYHRFKLGKLELTIVTDGHILFPSVQPNFAPGIDSNQVNNLLEDNFLPTNQADLSINVLIVKSDHKLILIDTGCGLVFGEKCGWLVKNLKQLDILPEQITDIILTHGHPDHIGGLINRQGESMFTSASIYVSRIEKDFWMHPHPDLSKSKMNNEVVKKLIIDTAHQTFTKTQKQLQLFEDGDILLNCLKLTLAPGHTPGHSIITIFSEGQEIVHTGDLVHSSVLVFAHPEWGFDGDTDFDLAAQTRKAVLEQLVQSRKQVFSYHLPWPGLGHVRRKESGYEWVQNTFALPG